MDDGYPIQWVRSAIPSNTLACLNGLAEDARRRRVLGPNVEIRLHTHDETNRRVRPDRIIRMIRREGGRALIGRVGVQSNQFPRAVDLARQFLAAGLSVPHPTITYAGYILGFPGDTKESIKRDIDIIKRELPLDILEFFFLTPLPGSEDHKVLWQNGAWMDPDMNKYDLNHRVSHHSKMSDTEWDEAYRAAWETYYTPEHIQTILRRVAANPLGRLKTTLTTILWFYLAFTYEGVHPLEGGADEFLRDHEPLIPWPGPLGP
jgi:hypothetical protein